LLAARRKFSTVNFFPFLAPIQDKEEIMNKDDRQPDVLKEMTEYVLYIRTREGTVQRRSNHPVFWCYESLIPYRHEEPLSGWPESRVFWAKPVGPSIGIAPLADISRPI
jgi:hypothetical protein